MIKIISIGLILVTGLFSNEIKENSKILVTQKSSSTSIERTIKFKNAFFIDKVLINEFGDLDGYTFNNTKCELTNFVKKKDSVFTCGDIEVNVFIRMTSTGSQVLNSSFNFDSTSESLITETKNNKFIRIATDLNLIIGSGNPILFK